MEELEIKQTSLASQRLIRENMVGIQSVTA